MTLDHYSVIEKIAINLKLHIDILLLTKTTNPTHIPLITLTPPIILITTNLTSNLNQTPTTLTFTLIRIASLTDTPTLVAITLTRIASLKATPTLVTIPSQALEVEGVLTAANLTINIRTVAMIIKFSVHLVTHMAIKVVCVLFTVIIRDMAKKT